MVTPKISLPSTMGKAMMMRMTIDSPTISKMVGRPPTFSNNHDSLQLETCRQDIYKSLRKQKFLFPPPISEFWPVNNSLLISSAVVQSWKIYY